MSYHMPDLTGADPLHRIDNDVHAVLSGNKIYFTSPVFADSVVLKLIGIMPSKDHTEYYNRNTEWTVLDDDIDKVATSRITTMDTSFDKLLIKSLTILVTYPGTPYKLDVSYQQLYPNVIRTGTYMSEPLVFTPALLQSMLDELNRLRLQVSRVHDVATPESEFTRLMMIDPHKNDPLNYVEKEVHTLDTPNGVAFIKPVYGSFYYDSVTVYHPLRQEQLTEGTHYRIVGMNVAKTKATKHTSPVFDFILFIDEMVGQVEISYHAYGGEAETVHFQDAWDRIMDITNYLNEARFITEYTLGNTQVIGCLENRIAKQEENMRRLLLGKPSYGDVTHGSTRIYKITAPDSNLHWWSIATLFKVDGSDTIISADRMKLRINLMHSKCIMDVYLSFNLNNPSGSKFSVSLGDGNLSRGYVPYTDYSGIDTIVAPQFRAIWNDDPARQSGVIIQIGLPLKNVFAETIGIEDMSGMECCWKLRDETDIAIGTEDSTIALPAEAEDMANYFVWSINNPRSMVESTLIPTKHGHLIWAGAHCLNRPGGWASFTIPHLLDPLTDYKRITKVRLELAERGSYKFPIDIDLVPGMDVMVGSTTASYYRNPLDVMIQLERNDETDEIVLILNTNVTEVGANPLDLMGVVIFT